MDVSLPVINLNEATYDCIFGRGCDGICCKNGRPPVYEDEVERIQDNMEKFLPHLTPAARKLIEKQGFLSKRIKYGMPMVRVIDSWCVFFNEGCVLHKVGAMEGDKYLYKPSACALFPLQKNKDDQWYVRQHGQPGEQWTELFCLDPKATKVSAAESLKEEVALAMKFEAEDAAKG